LPFDTSPLAKSISTAWFKEEDVDEGGVDLHSLFVPGFKIIENGPDDDEVKKLLLYCLGYNWANAFIDPSIFKNL
jgi:hypothetical protein